MGRCSRICGKPNKSRPGEGGQVAGRPAGPGGREARADQDDLIRLLDSRVTGVEWPSEASCAREAGLGPRPDVCLTGAGKGSFSTYENTDLCPFMWSQDEVRCRGMRRSASDDCPDSLIVRLQCRTKSYVPGGFLPAFIEPPACTLARSARGSTTIG